MLTYQNRKTGRWHLRSGNWMNVSDEDGHQSDPHSEEVVFARRPRGASGRSRLRFASARSVVGTAGLLSKVTGQGEGSSIGGAIARRLWPNLLADLAEGVEICLVTGTNGKSTTTHMLAACMASVGPVAFNSGGSNMENGAVVALAREPDAKVAVLEVDEAFLGRVADTTRPRVIVLLNLTRESTRGVVLSDLQRSWSAFFSSITWECEFIANADDPIVVSTLPQDVDPHWVAGGDVWTSDSAICPRCHAALSRSENEWWCDDCGLTRPKAAWRLQGDKITGPGFSESLSLIVPGDWARSNALFAVAAASAIGVEPSEAIAAIGMIANVEGRYGLHRREGRDVRLIMVKNAASWQSALTVGDSDSTFVFAQEPFGPKDMAPLWEVDMSGLSDRKVVVAGQRRRDISTRLDVEGITYRSVVDPLEAIRACDEGDVYVIANYTAFLDLRHSLETL